MAEKLVKYNLIKFGNGFITPYSVFDGGNYWEYNSNISSSIFYGKANLDLRKSLPEGIIEVISQEQLDEHIVNLKEIKLKKYKSKLYSTYCDPLLNEAIAEKLQGREDKWNKYLEKRQEIYDITEVPTMPGGGLA